MGESTLRERLTSVTLDEATAEKIQQIVRANLDVVRGVKCLHCGRLNQVPMPNLDALLKLLKALEGEVATQVDVTHMHIPVGAVITELSQEQLEALESGRATWEQIEDGEFVALDDPPRELPPAA